MATQNCQTFHLGDKSHLILRIYFTIIPHVKGHGSDNQGLISSTGVDIVSSPVQLRLCLSTVPQRHVRGNADKRWYYERGGQW